MKHSEARRLVRQLLPKWQKCLRLRDWRIEVEFLDDTVTHRTEREEFYGYTTVDPKRMEAKIELATKRPPEAVEDVLVHELVHVVLGELVCVVPGEDSTVKALEERAVLRITKALVGRKRVK